MEDDPKALNRRFFEEVLHDQNLAVIDELVAEDCVDHIPLPEQGPGREGIRQAIQWLITAFPDIRFEIVVDMAEGDLVSAVTRMTGTNQGEFMGMPATGRQVSIIAVDVGRVRDGKFVEHWGLVDQGSLMEQLGVTQ